MVRQCELIHREPANSEKELSIPLPLSRFQTLPVPFSPGVHTCVGLTRRDGFKRDAKTHSRASLADDFLKHFRCIMSFQMFESTFVAMREVVSGHRLDLCFQPALLMSKTLDSNTEMTAGNDMIN